MNSPSRLILADLAAMDSEAIGREAQLESAFANQDWDTFDEVIDAEYQADKARYEDVNDGEFGPGREAAKPGTSPGDAGAYTGQVPPIEAALGPVPAPNDGPVVGGA